MLTFVECCEFFNIIAFESFLLTIHDLLISANRLYRWNLHRKGEFITMDGKRNKANRVTLKIDGAIHNEIGLQHYYVVGQGISRRRGG